MTAIHPWVKKSHALQSRLTLYLEARRPILFIRHGDATSILPLLTEAGRLAGYDSVSTFTHARAVNPPMKCGPLKLFLETMPRSTLAVLEDVHRELKDPVIVALLKHLANQVDPETKLGCPVVIVSRELVVPPELEHLITVIEVPRPEREEIQSIIEQVASEEGAPMADQGLLGTLVESFRGLHETDIRQILRLGLIRGNWLFTDAITEVILEEKKQIIAKASLLEFIDATVPFDEVGGLVSLKRWLDRKARIFEHLEEAKRAHVEIPKGFLLVGLPGCGKSLAAKATADRFKLPLLRLDVGKLLGSYVGQSEANMRMALQLAEAVSPCVVWVDEIEKAFAGLKNPHDQVTRRLLGALLTWMQENESPVFLVATANDIEDLPPEMLRRGRFDEVFAVELPRPEERQAILRVHLQRRKQNVAAFDLAKLSGHHTDGFSGADLETLVKEALELAFCEDRPMEMSHLMEAHRGIRPMAKSMGQKIKQQREALAKYDILSAN